VHVSLEPSVAAVNREVVSVNPGVDGKETVTFVEPTDDVMLYVVTGETVVTARWWLTHCL